MGQRLFVDTSCRTTSPPPRPLDRILIAQTQQHGLTLASLDEAVRAYPVPLLPRVPSGS